MKIVRLFVTLCFVFLLHQNSQAQEWGEVQPYEWRTTPPREFANLGAAIIFDKGLATTEQKGLKYERHVRSILLNKSGIEFIGQATIECYEYDYLTGIKAHILSPDGSIHKLEDRYFEKQKTGLKQKVIITFPDLVPGDIIEYKYQIDYYGGYDKLGAEKYFMFGQKKRYSVYLSHKKYTLNDWDDEGIKRVSMMPSWYFDNPVYTFSSEFSAKIGGDIDYIYYTTNLPPDRMTPTIETVKIFYAPVYKKHSWYMENIPPMVLDTTNIVEAEAQQTAIHFRLLSIDGVNRIIAGEYSDTHWKFVGESFQGYSLDYLKTNKSLRKKARELVSNKLTEMEKLEAIYNFITFEIDVDPSGYDLRPLNKSLKQLYKKKQGMPFELNLLLVEMLKIAGVKAAPILISTRNKISFRTSGRFNHMITRVSIDGFDMLVDVSSTECPLGKLPIVSMVTEGVGIDYDNSKPCLIVPIGCE